MPQKVFFLLILVFLSLNCSFSLPIKINDNNNNNNNNNYNIDPKVLAYLLKFRHINKEKLLQIQQQQQQQKLKAPAELNLNKENNKNEEETKRKVLIEGIKNLQFIAGIPQTGIVDKKTKYILGLKRCGNTDQKVENSRNKKRSNQDENQVKWFNNDLSYKFHLYSQKIPTYLTKRAIRNALNLWSSVTPLSFTEKPWLPKVNIPISFYYRDHGDGFPFAQNTLAHTFYPLDGRCHFNEEVNWNEVPNGNYLYKVATHEFGHALGLNHSTDSRDVMYAYYTPYHKNFNLTLNDIQRIQKLYGSRYKRLRITTTTTTTTTKTTTTTTSTLPYTPLIRQNTMFRLTPINPYLPFTNKIKIHVQTPPPNTNKNNNNENEEKKKKYFYQTPKPGYNNNNNKFLFQTPEPKTDLNKNINNVNNNNNNNNFYITPGRPFFRNTPKFQNILQFRVTPTNIPKRYY